MPKVSMKIVGIGERREGVSKKNGKPYCMQDISVVYSHESSPGYIGSKAESITVNPDVFDLSGLHIGDEVEAFVHQQNYRTVLDGII